MRSLFSGVVLLALAAGAVAACKTEQTLADTPCPPGGTTLTYASFGRDFLAQNCQTCHGQSADQRQGAPPNFDFGTLDDVHAHRDRVFARAAGDNTSMPPGPNDPPASERDKLAEWLACGAP